MVVGKLQDRSDGSPEERRTEAAVAACACKVAELPDVPLVMDFARNEEQKLILELLLAGQSMAWPVFAPAKCRPIA